MTDHKKLIAEARELDPRELFEVRNWPEGAAELAHALADALEAATVPNITDGMVERAARQMAGLGVGEEWPTNEELGGGLTGTRDDEYRAGMHEEARAVLEAVTGVAEVEG